MMNRTNRLAFCVVSTLLALLFPLEFISAQQGLNRWVYILTSTPSSYDLLRVSSGNGMTEQIFSLASPPRETFTTILPSTEVNLARTFLAGQGMSVQAISTLASKKLDVSIEGMTVAPDNGEVALRVKYQAC